MNTYITEKMASVGCGASDIKDIASIATEFTTVQKDIVDGWYNNGIGQVLPEYLDTAESLHDSFTEDDLICLGAYVSARRNIEEF